MYSLTADHGRYGWMTPIATGPTHFESVSTASGVVYTMTNLGELLAVDAATGVPMVRRSLALDVGTYAGDLSSQGVAIARNTIYAPAASFVVAYR
jgi:hypothetical protein